MDLSNRDDLKRTIRSIFHEEAAASSMGFAGVPNDAIEPLIRPGLNWKGDLRDVDLDLLRAAIRHVVERLSDPARPRHGIDRATVAAALKESDCHYLWFC